MEKIIVILACFALCAGAAAQDNEYVPLDAKFQITNENLQDLGASDKRDRVALSVQGDSAKAIYNAMLTPARRVDCDEKTKPNIDLPMRKVAGGLVCEQYKGEKYYCSAAIKLDTGKTESGQICDPQ